PPARRLGTTGSGRGPGSVRTCVDRTRRSPGRPRKVARTARCMARLLRPEMVAGQPQSRGKRGEDRRAGNLVPPPASRPRGFSAGAVYVGWGGSPGWGPAFSGAARRALPWEPGQRGYRTISAGKTEADSSTTAPAEPLILSVVSSFRTAARILWGWSSHWQH